MSSRGASEIIQVKMKVDDLRKLMKRFMLVCLRHASQIE